MGLPDELLSQAHVLATMDRDIPVQANLRRAISSAYYAVFHLLIAEAVQSLVKTAPGLPERVSRSFNHGDMKNVALRFLQKNPPVDVTTLLPGGISKELRNIADTFCSLQQARHNADYALDASFTREETLSFIEAAELLFEDWRTISGTDESTVFLAALAFGARWSR